MPLRTTIFQRALSERIESKIFLPFAKNELDLSVSLRLLSAECAEFVTEHSGRYKKSRERWANIVQARFYYYLVINERSSVHEIESAIEKIAETHVDDAFEIVSFMNSAAHLLRRKCSTAAAAMLQRAIKIIDGNKWPHIWEEGRLGCDFVKLAKTMSLNIVR